MATKHFEHTSSRTTTVDGKDVSEEVHIKNITKKIENEPAYVKLYFRDISVLHKVQKQTEAVLFELVKRMDYVNHVSISAGTKREICEKLQIFSNSLERGVVPGTKIFDQHVYRLIAAGLLVRKDIGLYLVNPDLFGKGRWGEIKNIRLQIKYSDNGRMVFAEINKKEIEHDKEDAA